MKWDETYGGMIHKCADPLPPLLVFLDGYFSAENITISFILYHFLKQKS